LAEPEFDEVLLSRARLGVVSVLLGRSEATFAELGALLGLTRGNLGMHLRTLEDAGYVAVHKDFRDRRPCTTLRLTPKGRRAVERHVGALAQLLLPGTGPAAARAPTSPRAPRPRTPTPGRRGRSVPRREPSSAGPA
jgi:DNA-binding MarR family transcriptional regulator